MLFGIQGLVSIIVLTHRYSLMQRNKKDPEQGPDGTLDKEFGRNLKR